MNVPHAFNNSSANSLDAHDVVGQWLMHPEALTPYEHMIFQSLQWDGNMCSLDQLITFREFAISCHPDGHPSKPGLLVRLGITLEKKGLEDQALGAYERALDVAGDSKGLSLTIICFLKIGYLRHERYDRLGEAEDINKAIWGWEMCIACTAADSYADVFDRFYVFLCASLMARWELLNDKEDLDRLLYYAEKAIALNPSNDGAQYFLGLTLCISYDHHHTLALLDRAILATQRAVSYSIPHNRMESLIQLACTYYRRLLHVRDPSDAFACIKYIDQAMECGKISFNLHMMLIECLHGAFSSSSGENDVQYDVRALVVCETLLADDSLSGSERCMARLVLGSTLLERLQNCIYSEISRDPRQLEKCIQTVQHVIECTSPEHPRCHRYRPYDVLTKALLIQLRIGNATVSEFEYAITIGRKAVEVASNEGDDDVQAHCLVTLGGILFTYGQDFPSRETQEQCVLVSRQASQLSSPTGTSHLISAMLEAEQCFLMQDWKGCFNANTIAMEAIHHQTWLGLSVVQQHRVISGSIHVKKLGRQAARAAVHFDSSEMALEWIEQCRSIVWRRVLNLRVSMDAVANVELTLAHRLKEVSDLLQRHAYFDLLGMEEGSLEMKKQQRYRLAEEWEDLVAQTRKLPGFTDFLKPKGHAYFTSCEFGGMVVLLNVYSGGCDAIVLGSNTAKLVAFPLREMNEERATILQTLLHETLQKSGRHSRDARASEPWYRHNRQDGMSFVLSMLWTTVVKPLFDFLDLEVCTLYLTYTNIQLTCRFESRTTPRVSPTLHVFGGARQVLYHSFPYTLPAYMIP